MARFNEDSLRSITEHLQRGDPHLTRALSHHRLAGAHRRHHRGSAWATLALAATALALGIALPHGLLIATGLVLAGITANFFDPLRARSQSPRLRSL
ncbi:DUF3040 domain-containing protein [Streptomyces sp. Ru72]|uniref:DUF3040 domain-containing protein n=1 Tax=Streptomyces sp. Ru72 TaxID=2080747 RepID=UPI000CDDD00C|nr:DUF3040 domain-containing protein [Streptomyces sp. Ru72]POX44326.1 hypothetical protein C3488_33105 [Streptomyces sp. Ru72]